MNDTLQNHFFAKIGRLFNRMTVTTARQQTTQICRLSAIYQFDIVKIALADFVVIDAADIATTKALLKAIRSANQRMVYLKPIYITSLALYESLQHQVDGWYQPSQKQPLVTTATVINRRIKELESDPTNRDLKSNILRKTVQYLYTRGIKQLTPYASELSATTYAFPFVNSIFPVSKNLEVAQILETGVIEEWLEKEVVHTIEIDHSTIEINNFTITFAGEQLAKFGYYIEPKTIGLPAGILGLAPFQKLIQEELTHVQQKQHQSFLLEMGLIQQNLSFLTPKAQKELALDCLLYLQKSGISTAHFGFTPSNQFWLLLPAFTEAKAIATAENAFQSIQKMLREVLDSTQPLLELNLFNMQDCLPDIR